MPHCVVPNCYNRSSVKSRRQEKMEEYMNITFHQFPKAEERRLQWAKAVGFKLKNPCKNAYVCSLHFPEECFDRTSLVCVRLKSDAIPCLSKAEVLELTKDYSSSRTNKTATESNVSPKKIVANSKRTSLSYNATPERCIKSEEACEINISNQRSVTALLNESTAPATPLTSDVSTQTPTYLNVGSTPVPTDGKKTAVPQNSNREMPTETLLRTALLNQKEQSRKLIQTLKKRNRNQTLEIAELKSIISDLKAKNLKADEQNQILKTIGVTNMR